MSSNEASQEQSPVVEELDQEAQMRAEEEALVQAEDEMIERINQAEKKAEENWELLLRSKAEMENLRRRTQIDLENAHKYGIERFVSELLPVMDSMELGLAVENASTESLREGMTLTLNMVNQMFEKFNIKMIDPVNEPFNPELHQAMTAQPTDEFEPNTVIAVMQKGYLLNDRLVRPAMVMVSKAVE
ncbi:MAG: nucleotide exchange factor GrpE [Gammaproteobacteria bacterium]|nr:nucleotide exchange factor GrpE [Gammaproteobacteria bacterium]